MLVRKYSNWVEDRVVTCKCASFYIHTVIIAYTLHIPKIIKYFFIALIILAVDSNQKTTDYLVSPFSFYIIIHELSVEKVISF